MGRQPTEPKKLVGEVYKWLKDSHDKEDPLCNNARLHGLIGDDCTFCSVPCKDELEKRIKKRELRY